MILRLPSLEVPESAKRIIEAVTKTLVAEPLRHAMGNQAVASTWLKNKKWLEHARTVTHHCTELQLDGDTTATTTSPRRCCDCGGKMSHGIDEGQVTIVNWTCSGCKKKFPPSMEHGSFVLRVIAKSVSSAVNGNPQQRTLRTALRSWRKFC